MAIRIIKPGSAQARHVQKLHLGTRTVEDMPRPQIEVPEWMKHQQRTLPPPAPVPSTPQPEAASPVPVVDVALIEKTAYESGFRQGEKAGLAIAEKKIELSMRRYAEAVLAIGKVKAQLYTQVEHEVVKLAIEVAKKIVHREIQADREVIQSLVKVALSHVAEKSAVTVHLHPTDYSFILERRAELAQGADEGRDIVLLADKAIDRGGCLVETECGDIDARIEEEFREVERSFFEGIKTDGE
jgi:flagellar assembly protein FliH